MSRPIVALIGRPNCGKSTLFNRLLGRRIAIVHDRPGVTRDRHYGDAISLGHAYTLVDTGGFDPHGKDEMKQGIINQLEIGLSEADVIVCVLDANDPPMSVDSDEMDLLRRTDKPVIYLANKADSDARETEAHDLYRLGMDHLIFASALHGRGMTELEVAIVEALKALPGYDANAEEEDDAMLRIAVIGRPNAGKSSLVNRLLGESRMLVDPRPGTTRDCIDAVVERGGKKYLFVDTAGLRKKSQVTKGRDAVEGMSVMQAIRSIDRAQVVVLLCDADRGVEEQDAKILGLALDRGRAIVIGLNKVDMLTAEGARQASSQVRDVLSFVPWAPVTRLSAKTGRGTDRLLKCIDEVSVAYHKRVGTGALNRFFETVLASHPPPIQKGRAPRFYYLTQARTAPPTFMVVTSHPDNLHFSYQRYVVNAIRKEFAFDGVPIRVHYRRKDRRPKKRQN